MSRDLGKIVVHLPARGGSKRVPRKNVRPINGKPMMAYTIEAALKSKYIEQVYINTDDKEMLETGEKYGATAYLREAHLANDQASSEDFNYDIIQKLKPDTLIMINPVCPLIESFDIDNAIEAFIENDCDTLITSSSTKMQTFCEGTPVNIKTNEALKPSQDNPEVHVLNWAITIWDAEKFCERFEKLGYASLGEQRYLFAIDPLKAIKVSYEEDFKLVERLLS